MSTAQQTNPIYVLPSNNAEHGRLNRQSLAINAMIGGAPLHTTLGKPQKIIDIGCGTGIITTALARAYPEAEAYGVDINPVPERFEKPANVPERFEKPANVQYLQPDIFAQADKHEELQFGTFDLVFHRMLVLGIADWTQYLRICFELLRPGARLELQDLSFRFFDIDDQEVSKDWKWMEILTATAKRRNNDVFAPEQLREYVAQAGFQDVREVRYMWTWSEESWEQHPDSDQIGRYCVEELRLTMKDLVGKSAKGAGLEGEEVERMQEDMMQNTVMPRGGHQVFYLVTGMKPS